MLTSPTLPISSSDPLQAATCARMADAYSQLRASLVSLYRRFAADSEDVQHEWVAYLRRADGQVLDALTACVRRGLYEVARALQGEHKAAEISPVFVLSVILDTNGRWVLHGWRGAIPPWHRQECWQGPHAGRAGRAGRAGSTFELLCAP